MPTPSPEPHEIVEHFHDFIENSRPGNQIVRAARDIEYHDRTVTITYSPAHVGATDEALLSVIPNRLAVILGTPIAFNDQKGTYIRSAVDLLTVLSEQGEVLDEISTEELHARAVS
ncbi:hypothetical protein [Corynebacterium marinum]|uniref:hypothetical protein n=1 Tax=Corynebacterium marinum TaxID=349751 RepID=UPI0012EB4FB8|nr:hypothetical protein [Corynebacterium marinum]GGO22096.1 hypothetical protein GCM10010980_23800 [Corynebacterium marinum]